MKKTLCDNIVRNTPKQKINRFLRHYGEKPARTAEEAISKVKAVVRDEGEEALINLGKIHPDKKLIVESLKNDYKHTNSCGVCGGTYNAAGEETDKTTIPIHKYIKNNAGTIALIAVVIGVIGLTYRK